MLPHSLIIFEIQKYQNQRNLKMFIQEIIHLK